MSKTEVNIHDRTYCDVALLVVTAKVGVHENLHCAPHPDNQIVPVAKQDSPCAHVGGREGGQAVHGATGFPQETAGRISAHLGGRLEHAAQCGRRDVREIVPKVSIRLGKRRLKTDDIVPLRVASIRPSVGGDPRRGKDAGRLRSATNERSAVNRFGNPAERETNL